MTIPDVQEIPDHRHAFRGKLAADWTLLNPILGLKEAGYEEDTGNLKFGDGVTAWNDLDYWVPGNVQSLVDDAVAAEAVTRAAADAAETARAMGVEAALAAGLRPIVALVVSTTNISGALSGTKTIDGVAVTAGKTVFLPAQTTGKDRGPWVVHSGAWTRPPTYATGSDATGTIVFIEAGTAPNVGSSWMVTGAGPYVVDTDSTTWLEAPTSLTFTAPLVKTGSVVAPTFGTTAGTFMDGADARVLAALASGVTAWAATTQVFTTKLYRLPTGGLAYPTAGMTTRASFDATERAAWTFLPGGHYEKVTSSGTWVLPTGVKTVRTRGKGSGAGGSGGGAATTSGGVTTQIGGPGGGAGNLFDETWTPTGNLTWTIGAGGAFGAGGAANNHPGVTGSAGSQSSVTDSTTTYTADGGSSGAPPPGNSTAVQYGGAQGLSSSNFTGSAYLYPGSGGSVLNIAGLGAAPNGEMCGGGGGAAANATKGGVGGAVAAGPGQSAASVTAVTATTAGGVGANAIAPGHGGAGGGGGAPGGAGGNGGNGANGVGEVWF